MHLPDGLLYRQSKRRTRERYTQKAGSTNDVFVLRYALRAQFVADMARLC